MASERASPKGPDSDGSVVSTPQVEQLIATLEGEGSHSTSGEFTLERKEAVRRTREIVSHAPHRSALHLIQAAVLRGASEVDIQLTDREVLFTFDGAPFQLQCLEQLYDTVFTSFEEPDMAGVRELALGLAAFQNLEPQSMRVRSGGGDGLNSMELEIGKDKEDVMGPCRTGLEGTEIRITFPFGSTRSAKSPPLSETLIRELQERTAYARLSIRCNGELLAPGVGLSRDAVGVIAISNEGVTGAVGYAVKRRKKAKVRIVRNGVWVDTVSESLAEEDAVELRLFDSLSLSPAPLSVVASDRLGFDLSGEKVIRNQALREVKQSVFDARVAATDKEELQLALEDRYRLLASEPMQELLGSYIRRSLFLQPLAFLAAVVVFLAICGLTAVVAMLVIYILDRISSLLAQGAFIAILFEALTGLYLAWMYSSSFYGGFVSRLIRKPIQARFRRTFRDRVSIAAARSIMIRDYAHYEQRKWMLK